MSPTPTPTPELAAIYRRVSTDHQDDSLVLQEKRVLDYANFKALGVDEGLIFSDPDTSGGTPMLDRTGGRALLNRLKLGDVHHLVVAKVDRLGRNVRDGMATLEFLKEHNITLHIVDLGGESISTQGHIGKLILTLMFAFAEWELGEIQDRTRKQMRSKFDKHELTGNVPYGWDVQYSFTNGTFCLFDHALSAAELLPYTTERGPVISKTLAANPFEQKNIRLMHALRNPSVPSVPLVSYTKVAAELNRLGHRTKQGSPWQCGHVSSVLNNRHTRRLLEATAPKSDEGGLSPAGETAISTEPTLAA